ncbi:MAG: WYL domain-containing transcriptional regulator [Clostridia bacterium]|nr:WYL domain-containing transcriptional regulator [Clostridia bacterium]
MRDTAYSELVKNFNKIREYLREFYVYGFKTRTEYSEKSARSYDDERRRIENWLSGYIRISQTPEGKNVSICVDTRDIDHNPFFKALKTKSFTDGDITMHFMIFDLLPTPDKQMTLRELMDGICDLANECGGDAIYDDSTLRKKLKEYEDEGIIIAVRDKGRTLYSRAPDTDLSGAYEMLGFASETQPCGALGNFMQDKLPAEESPFAYKHNSLTGVIDSDIVCGIFLAMSSKSYIEVKTLGKREKREAGVSPDEKAHRVVPVKLLVSSQEGKETLVAYIPGEGEYGSFRIDRIKEIKIGDPCPDYEKIREDFTPVEAKMWGTVCRSRSGRLEHVSFIIQASPWEDYIVRRLEREKRTGTVTRVDDTHYMYSADVYDSTELLPWIRTFICRITQLDFSNRTIENRFKKDLREMYALYGLEGVQP